MITYSLQPSFLAVAVFPGNETDSFARYPVFQAEACGVKGLVGRNNQEARRYKGWMAFDRRLGGRPAHYLDSNLYVKVSLEVTEKPGGVESITVRVIVVIGARHLNG